MRVDLLAPGGLADIGPLRPGERRSLFDLLAVDTRHERHLLRGLAKTAARRAGGAWSRRAGSWRRIA